jgi:hypothetical protein
VTDIRARLADALFEIAPRHSSIEEIVDGLLSLPGIAIADRGRFENALLDAWDCGNATGLDGPLDREASRYNRQRDADLILTALLAAAVQAQEDGGAG